MLVLNLQLFIADVAKYCCCMHVEDLGCWYKRPTPNNPGDNKNTNLIKADPQSECSKLLLLMKAYNIVVNAKLKLNNYVYRPNK